MYLKRLLVIAIVIFMIFTFTACGSKVSKNNILNNENITETKSSLSGENESTFTIETIDISDIENGKTYQEIKYPVIEYKGDDNLSKSIGELNKKLKELAEKFKVDNKESIRDYIKELKNEDAMYSYDSSITCTCHNDKYLSFLNSTYIFTMGAHGSTIENGYTYDVKTGKLLTLKDFVKDIEELKKFLKDWVKNQNDDMFYKEADSNIDMYFTGEYELQFTLMNGELKVIFQQYDIAPYAVGIIEIPIDKSLLKVELN